MNNTQAIKESNTSVRFTSASRDLIIIGLVCFLIFVISYYLDVFKFLVESFQKHPDVIAWIDEIITVLVTLSIGLAVFSWRRLLEVRRESAERIKLQEELINNAEIKAETERIICKQLHCDIDAYRKAEREVLSQRYKTKGFK
jgi:uncharacterized membrane protein YcjF (UPF0283 family)